MMNFLLVYIMRTNPNCPNPELQTFMITGKSGESFKLLWKNFAPLFFTEFANCIAVFKHKWLV